MKALCPMLLSLFISVPAAFASWQAKPECRLTQSYRYDLRHQDHDLYITRASAGFNYLNTQGDAVFNIVPFFELRQNTERHFVERKEVGVEVGGKIFPWLYVGEGFQAVWLKEDYTANYSHTKKRDATEAETRLEVMHRLFCAKGIEVKGFLLDEYTYDFDIGGSTRNEVCLGVVVPLHRHVETKLNWRHIDLIHDYDSDVLEGAVTVVF